MCAIKYHIQLAFAKAASSMISYDNMRLAAFLLSLFILTAPMLVEARLVPVACDAPGTCGTCEFVELINNVIEFVITFSTIAATIVIMYGGFKLLTSGGNVAAKGEAKKYIVNVIIGYVILLSAFLVVNTLLSALVGGGAEGRILNWRTIQCIYPVKSVETKNVPGLADPDVSSEISWERVYGTSLGVSSGNVSGSSGSSSNGGSGGSCSVPASGYCAPRNLSCFGSRATKAASICNIESGGNFLAKSGTDLCKDRRTFSGGLFQINILANNRYYNNCSPDFFEKNGSGAQGNCLQWVENKSGVRYCQIRDCRITNVSKYNSCMEQTFTPSSNIRIACDLFKASGNDFDPWITSAKRCKIN